jgi:hypothetical protein
MKIETRKIYTCDFCKKYYKSKRFGKLHEKRCYNNPKNFRDCFSCTNMEFKKLEVILYSYGDRDNLTFSNCFFCKLLNVGLIPPIAKHRGNSFDMKIENIDMPKKCENINKDYIGQKMLEEGDLF